MRSNSRFNIGQLVHEDFVNSQTTRCIDDNNIFQHMRALLYSATRNIYWISTRCFISKYWNIDLLPYNLQLSNRGWTIYVGSYEHWMLTLFAKVYCQFTSCCSLTSTLQTNEHDNRWRFARNHNTALCTA